MGPARAQVAADSPENLGFWFGCVAGMLFTLGASVYYRIRPIRPSATVRRRNQLITGALIPVLAVAGIILYSMGTNPFKLALMGIGGVFLTTIEIWWGWTVWSRRRTGDN
jgi:hypothetical protein